MFVCCLGFRCCRLAPLTHAVAKRQEADAETQRIKLEIAKQRCIVNRLKLLLHEKAAAGDRMNAEAGRRDCGAAGAGAALPRGGREGGGSSSCNSEGERGGSSSERGGGSTNGESKGTGGNGSSSAAAAAVAVTRPVVLGSALSRSMGPQALSSAEGPSQKSSPGRVPACHSTPQGFVTLASQ